MEPRAQREGPDAGSALLHIISPRSLVHIHISDKSSCQKFPRSRYDQNVSCVSGHTTNT